VIRGDLRPTTKSKDRGYTDVVNASIAASANEVEFAKRYRDNFHLYCVYEYQESTSSGRFYVGTGEVEQMFDLTPTQYQAARSREDQTN
jgi:uncharacterized protein DUF3883